MDIVYRKNGFKITDVQIINDHLICFEKTDAKIYN